MVAYPRVYVKASTHAKVLARAKKMKVNMKDIGDKIVLAGLAATK